MRVQQLVFSVNAEGIACDGLWQAVHATVFVLCLQTPDCGSFCCPEGLVQRRTARPA